MHRLYLTGAAALLAGTTAFAAVAKPAQVTAGVNVYAVSEQGCLFEVQAAGSVQQKGKECVFAQASAGHQHTLVLRRDGRIQGFGANSWGELGTGLAGGNYVNLVNTGGGGRLLFHGPGLQRQALRLGSRRELPPG